MQIAKEILDKVYDPRWDNSSRGSGYVALVFNCDQTDKAGQYELWYSTMAFKGSHKAVQSSIANCCYHVEDPTIDHVAFGRLRLTCSRIYYKLVYLNVEGESTDV